MRPKKYYKTSVEAMRAKEERNAKECRNDLLVFRMPKGSRKAGWYAVCTYLEYVNTY